ncbi:MAG TPA: tetratricopeptide repeat protein [Steroidobacteraceae bacterium]|nr:tetratricopeptide repeat protein [Steroidobacteraceae bacterium]
MSDTANQILANAHALLQQKRYAQAEALCREALAKWPRHGEALHLLGLIRKDAGDAVEGERLLRESIEEFPDRAEFRANLGNLLRRLARPREAAEAYREALRLDPSHRPARLALARTLADLAQAAEAERECRVLIAGNGRDARAWSTLGAVLRQQHRLSDAESAFRQAIALAPADAGAHHNLGALLSQAERAEEALAALEKAASLGLKGRELAFNRGRVLQQLYRLDEAEGAFVEAVRMEPNDIDAQLNLARLRYMRNDPAFTREIADAVRANRANLRLQLLLGDVLRRTGLLEAAEVLLRDILKGDDAAPEVRAALATVLHEAGRLNEAEEQAALAAAARPNDAAIIETLVAILLGRDRATEALPFIRARRALEPNEQRWIAYEATAARLLGDPLYQRLYDYERLVKIYELQAPPGWSSMAELNTALATALAARHRFEMHPFDQSLRHGSQTARSLLTDPDPAIRTVLTLFVAAVDQYRASIGTDPEHPLSARNHGATALAGCWSVQLHRQGFHVNHIHPQGWISSAYYVSVPAEVADTELKSGWLKFGEPRFPIPRAIPARFVAPRAGRLVLFPSYMWHGTNPIQGSEPRTSIAFDAVPGEKSAGV